MSLQCGKKKLIKQMSLHFGFSKFFKTVVTTVWSRKISKNSCHYSVGVRKLVKTFIITVWSRKIKKTLTTLWIQKIN
jgi:hypothetical protein